ncbi:MAG: PQQ-binding-like beta-propeller repeat protein [Myxococcota bacterium]|nr:PQQ-binding-like beta-propeller repeat protein [Myxococcota bacterium]
MRLPARLVIASGLALLAGCGPDFLGGGSYRWVGGGREAPEVSTRAIRLRWRQQISIDYEGAYVPVERSRPALDPGRDRLYVGSAAGEIWAMTATGARIYTYDAGSGIAAQPTLDVHRNELFVSTEGGVVHKLDASDGDLAWRSEVGGAISREAVLTEDAIYVVSDDDVVSALDRETGEALWRYRRDAPEGFYVSAHAGLTLADGHLLTAFTSGVVVSLDPADGAVRWERDTAAELEPGPDGTPRFADVDTTPLVIDDLVYIASFAGGLYALELESGSVRWRDEALTGVTHITAASRRLLVLSSAELGVALVDREDREILWRKVPPRGAPGPATVTDDLVLFGESQGGFITLSLTTGRELGRIETGHGFSARAAVADGRGFVLTNGGVLLAFALPGAR